ncbi:peroxiredoxin [Caldiplasma sukawensis]
MALPVGTPAPDFTGIIETGNKIRLSDFIGRNYIILYFYPKDESFGCKREACEFRDEFDDFKTLDAKVLGVSIDSVESHREFIKKRNLNFSLVSDPDGKIWADYDVKVRPIQYMNQRVTYLIGLDGRIKFTYTSAFNFRMHPKLAKEALFALNQHDAVGRVMSFLNREYRV